MSDSYNVLPVNDLKEHTESEFCECEPKVEIVNGIAIITHNSYDGREAVEWADEILNKN